MIIDMSIPDRPDSSMFDLDAYLAGEIRRVLENWSKLAAG